MFHILRVHINGKSIWKSKRLKVQIFTRVLHPQVSSRFYIFCQKSSSSYPGQIENYSYYSQARLFILHYLTFFFFHLIYFFLSSDSVQFCFEITITWWKIIGYTKIYELVKKEKEGSWSINILLWSTFASQA